MRRIRFNIASLLVVVLFVAVGFAALRESNDLWDSGLFTLTLGVLLISILLAIHRTESRRAFWIGFALFGWIYLGLSLVPSIESRLMTTKALAYLDSKVPGRSSGALHGSAHGDRLGYRQQSGPEWSPSPQTGINLPPPATAGEALGCDDRQAARWLERHNRELHADWTLAVRLAGGLVRRATLSPSLASFQIVTRHQRRSMLKGPLRDRPLPPSRQDPQHLRSPLSRRLEAGG